MLALRESCEAFALTLDRGPDLCPHGLFAGTWERALLGLKVHANTVSHARLVALEDSFPHTMEAMGHAMFNAASRNWLDTGHGRSCALAQIGNQFPDWLARQPDCSSFTALAQFEWFWLEAFHAAEAAALTPEMMQKMQASSILETIATSHPAVRIAPADAPVAELCGFATAPEKVVITRPDSEILIHPANAATADLLSLFDGKSTFQTVLETFWADRPNEDAVAGINQLVSIGALTLENASC
jgi:hypothetical protein